jgi:integrase
MAARMVKTRHPGIYRRGERYVVVYRLNGRQKKESARTLEEARALKRSRETSRDRGELRERSKVSFGEACAEWLRYVEHDRQRRPSTLRDYRNVANGYLLVEFVPDTPLERITTERIDAFRERMLAEGQLSRRSVQKVLVILHGILKRAKRRGWIHANPAEDVERVSVKRSGEFNVLSPAEVLAVARAAEDDQDGALIIVAAFTGLRLGELRALRWSDVDFALSTVRVRGNYTHGAAGPPKSGLVRSTPLIDHAARELDRLSRRERLTGPEDLVFCSVTGEHRDDSKMRRAFYRALREAGFGRLRKGPHPFRFHDLRHTFGTLAVQAWSLHDVQGYMGHQHISTTMLYVHHQPRASAAADLTRLVDAAVGAGESGNRVATDQPALGGTGTASTNGDRAQDGHKPDSPERIGTTVGIS